MHFGVAQAGEETEVEVGGGVLDLHAKHWTNDEVRERRALELKAKICRELVETEGRADQVAVQMWQS